MRSASVGEVPIMQSHGPIVEVHGQGAFSHVQQASPQNHRRNVHEGDSRSGNRAMMNGMPVQKATTTESVAVATHRRSASDMTFESQTSEKKPPRPPKKSPGLPPGIGLQQKKQNAPVVKGWRSRLSEQIRAAFSGPPRAHMGVENKFRYDKERGRWIMEGEDPNEDDEIPPPPPDDDAMVGEKPKVPFSQSYESLPNPDLGDQLMQHSNGANSEGADGLIGGAAGADNFRRCSNAQFGHNRARENATSRDAGSESSVASAASAPVPHSSQPGISMSASSGNKFRAHPVRLSGRRAYVGTFNKGTPVSSIPASLEMKRVCKPGGVVAVREGDVNGFLWMPQHIGFEKFRKGYKGALRCSGGDDELAGKLPLLAKRVGFEKVDVSASNWCFSKREEREWWGGLWLERVQRGHLVKIWDKHGVLDADENNAVVEGIRMFIERDDGFFVLTHVEIVGHKSSNS